MVTCATVPGKQKQRERITVLSLAARGGGGAEGFVGGNETIAVGVELLELSRNVGIPLGRVFRHGNLTIAIGVAACEPGIEPLGQKFGRGFHAIAGFGGCGFVAGALRGRRRGIVATTAATVAAAIAR